MKYFQVKRQTGPCLFVSEWKAGIVDTVTFSSLLEQSTRGDGEKLSN